ncbi:hypothetical protein [Acidisoma cladoniae]|uniref:hypothetical protein n=1 Tax=Acidisoma cladoniae TaxID=3040935 RepID=UPI00254C69E1|nr:hypothetical protein [Acidisoma sp. PAMC 29798]
MDDGDAPPAEDDDFRALAEDWIALWQSEITAFMTDPETQHAWGAMLALWANAAQAMVRQTPSRGHESAPKSAGTPHAPGPAAVDAAPVARDDEIGRLERRVAELERHLAEQRPRPAGDHRRPHRPSRSRG